MTTTYTLTQERINDVVELLVTSLHHIPAAEPELKVDTNAMIHLLRSLTPNSGEPVIAWESTTPGYTTYITDAQYQSFSDTARRWYKPYKYSTTAPSTKPAEGWTLVPIELTDEMNEAAWESDGVDYVGEHKRIYQMRPAWAAMLAAAPQKGGVE